jgi:hypothetical protein
MLFLVRPHSIKSNANEKMEAYTQDPRNEFLPLVIDVFGQLQQVEFFYGFVPTMCARNGRPKRSSPLDPNQCCLVLDFKRNL